MVGHPGETEQDFEELLEFVKETRFERLGAFHTHMRRILIVTGTIQTMCRQA